MNKKRLLKLADLLEADAENPTGVKFDLCSWGEREGLPRNRIPKTVPVDCGTTACAVGLACISGAFKKDGLSYKLTSFNNGGGNNFSPRFGQYKEMEAVRQFFEIDSDQSYHLFVHWYYPRALTTGAAGEREVAKRIREMVANG